MRADQESTLETNEKNIPHLWTEVSVSPIEGRKELLIQTQDPGIVQPTICKEGCKDFMRLYDVFNGLDAYFSADLLMLVSSVCSWGWFSGSLRLEFEGWSSCPLKAESSKWIWLLLFQSFLVELLSVETKTEPFPPTKRYPTTFLSILT